MRRLRGSLFITATLLTAALLCAAPLSAAANSDESARQTTSATYASRQTQQVRFTPVRPGPRTPGTVAADWNESARSDKFTGGRIESAPLEEGAGGLEITVDVPAFRLTLWQNGREVKTYQIGVGMKQYPIVVGEREATEVIWNPAWIPPTSDWVTGHKGVKPGEIIKASDARNPLGKVKIPLGGGYLIHQAKGFSDLGNLVSHGCVRMLQSDLYDLAERINAADGWPVTKKQIARAKLSKRTLVATLEEPLPVDVNYDTLVVESGRLHIYPDVYERRTNTPARLRTELETSGVNTSQLDEATLEKMLARVTKGRQLVVEVSSIEAGRALEDARLEPIIKSPTRKRTVTKPRRAAR